MESIKIRKRIAKHLALSNKLQIAAREVLENEHLSVMDVATKYGLGCTIINRKIYIKKRKEEFYDTKRNLEAARIEIIEGKSTIKAASNNYGVKIWMLSRVVNETRAQENYVYDRKIAGNYSVFTYLQEESLLTILKDWARQEPLQDHCYCQFCALEKLLTLAYEFAKQNNIECPLWDTSRQASISWLIDFEMRHSDDITNSFVSFVNHFEQIIA